jgi:Flp pilus assembly pilin Flp
MTKLQNMIGMNLALMLGTLSVPSLEREEGQTLAEYALILALIAAVVAVAVIFLQSQISSIFTTIGNSI